MKKMRSRFSYANVMSSLSVFLVLGGATAFAATKVGTKDLKAGAVTTGKIKKEAITTTKIKKNAVTGAKLNESTLGTVPSATHATNATHAATATDATNATNATNAVNAQTVGGLSVKKFYAKIPTGGAETTIFSTNGVSLIAACVAGTTQLEAVKDAGAASMTATIAAFNTAADELATFGTSNFSSVDLDQGYPTLGGKFEVTTSGGTLITIQYTARDTNNYNPVENVCVYGGTVIAG